MNRDNDKSVLPAGLAGDTGMLQLAAQFFLLPARVFLAGMEMMADGLRSVQRLTGQSAGAAAPGFEPPAPRPPGPGRASTPGSVWTRTSSSPVTEGAVSRGAGKPLIEEESGMSNYPCSCGTEPCSCGARGACNPVICDRDLSGECCVKVVQYVVVSALQGVQDNNRILVGPETIAFSDDMTDDGFVSWVIALNADKLRHVDKKALRVMFCVFGRTPVMGVDLQEAQVAILANIAHTLKREGRDDQPAEGKDDKPAKK
jgi:hypothetical protein